MITHDYFVRKFSEISRVFNVSERRCDALKSIYYEHLNEHISEGQFIKISRHVLLNFDRMPTINQFMEVAGMYPDEKQTGPMHNCVICNSTGILKATKEGYKFIFKCSECCNCTCAYPEWNNSLRKSGYQPVFDVQDWSTNDEHQLKGLVFMGSNSRAWKEAPQKMREAAIEMRNKRGSSHRGNLAKRIEECF